MARPKSRLSAVYEDDVVEFLRRVGLLEVIEAGTLVCAICNQGVTLQNFRAAYPSGEDILVCCDKIDCFDRFAGAFGIRNK